MKRDGYLYDDMGEEIDSADLAEFVSISPRVVVKNYDVVLGACTDPTFWKPTKELIRKLGYKTYFPLRQLSGPGIFHEECTGSLGLEYLEIAMEKAKTNNSLLVSHLHCQAYPDKRLFNLSGGSVESAQTRHLVDLSKKLHDRAYNVKAYFALTFEAGGVQRVKFQRLFPKPC